MKKSVFIDGSAGTTGLRIRERLAVRSDVELISLPDEERKNAARRREALNSADMAFLCLPDAAAQEAADMVKNPDTVIFDTSTAHRTSPGWTYGFPELGPQQRRAVAVSKRTAVPGCHASGFIALVKPLADAGVIKPDSRLFCYSITGYSGGGRKMIEEYQAAGRPALFCAPRQYALGQRHKHLKEMQAVSGLVNAPVFCPVVADFYSGMEVTVPLFAEEISADAESIRGIYAGLYTGPVVKYAEDPSEDGFMSAAALSGSDGMQISVHGSGERILLVARYDNLGKGASGAAVQCMNIVMGTNETEGLQL